MNLFLLAATGLRQKSPAWAKWWIAGQNRQQGGWLDLWFDWFSCCGPSWFLLKQHNHCFLIGPLSPPIFRGKIFRRNLCGIKFGIMTDRHKKPGVLPGSRDQPIPSIVSLTNRSPLRLPVPRSVSRNQFLAISIQSSFKNFMTNGKRLSVTCLAVTISSG